jgi:hypothetical protein
MRDQDAETNHRKIQDFFQRLVGDRCRVHLEFELLEPEEEVDPPPTLEEMANVLAKNIDKCRRQGQASMLLQLLQTKFGLADGSLEERAHGAQSEQLLEWAKRILSADRLEDVFKD